MLPEAMPEDGLYLLQEGRTNRVRAGTRQSVQNVKRNNWKFARTK